MPPLCSTEQVNLMMRLYLISACRLGVWELSCHELKENNSIGIDIRLETVWVVILHPDNLWSLQTPKQHSTFLILSVLCFTTQKKSMTLELRQ